MQEFSPTKSIWGMVTVGLEGSGPVSEAPDNPFFNKGIEFRYLYIESHIKTKAGLEYARWAFEHGAQIRFAPSLPMRLAIFDGESAAMPLDPDNLETGAVIHHSLPVLHLAKSLYEYYWRNATNVFRGRAEH